MFTLRIETGNAAFADDPAQEIERILQQCADRLASSLLARHSGGPLFDANGNRIGAWEYVPETIQEEGDEP